MERKTKGEFVRADGVSSGQVEIYVNETIKGREIKGLSNLYGWTDDVSWEFASPVLLSLQKCELVFDGRRIPVSLRGDEREKLHLRFERIG